MFTDKLVAKIPSTATGKITEINFGDDDVIPVGHIILKIEEEGEGSEVEAAAPAHSMQAAAAPATNSVPVTNEVRDKVATAPPGNYSNQQARTGDKALSTPAVRHMAKKEGVDINSVPGTGKSGRVTKTDLLHFIKSGAGTSASAVAGGPSFQSSGPRIAPLYGVTEQDT